MLVFSASILKISPTLYAFISVYMQRLTTIFQLRIKNWESGKEYIGSKRDEIYPRLTPCSYFTLTFFFSHADAFPPFSDELQNVSFYGNVVTYFFEKLLIDDAHIVKWNAFNNQSLHFKQTDQSIG